MGFLQMLWIEAFPGWRIEFSVSWIILNASLNVLITALISFRLLLASYRNSQLLPSFSSKVYISIVAILVEAALPLSVTGIILACFINQSRGSGAARPHQGIFKILYFFFLVRPSSPSLPFLSFYPQGSPPPMRIGHLPANDHLPSDNGSWIPEGRQHPPHASRHGRDGDEADVDRAGLCEERAGLVYAGDDGLGGREREV